MFASRSFMFSGLMFKSLIHFELTFVRSLRLWSSSILLHMASSFLNMIYRRDCPFPTGYSWILCHVLIDRKCMGLFLSSLFWSIDLCVFILIPYYSLTIALYSLKLKKCEASSLVFFHKIPLGTPSLLWFHINFKIVCSISLRNAFGILIVIE